MLHATDLGRFSSRWPPNRGFEVLVKRRRNRLGIFKLVYAEEPAMDEFVDLNGETAITGPPARSASPHSLCGGFPCGFGLDGHIVGRLHNHTNVLNDDLFSSIIPYCAGRCTFLNDARFIR
jgi:hypothetical protein